MAVLLPVRKMTHEDPNTGVRDWPSYLTINPARAPGAISSGAA
jgi:hypothetical protein